MVGYRISEDASHGATEYSALAYWILGAVAAAAIAAAAALWLRSRGYRTIERSPFSEFAALHEFEKRSADTFDLAPFEEAKRRLLQDHHRAVRLQTHYLFFGDFSVALLLAALVTMSYSLTVGVRSNLAHSAAAALDVVALCGVMVMFALAKDRRRRWIKERARVEILRVWVATWGLLGFDTPEDALAGYEREAMHTGVADWPPLGELETAVQDRWSCLLHSFRTMVAGRSVVPSAAVRQYCRHRVARQANWFCGSRARIASQNRRRIYLVALLFGAALVLAAFKLYLGLTGGTAAAGAWAYLGLLVVIAISAALTANHYHRNIRSLHHRYGTQLRGIRAWLGNHSRILERAHLEGPLSARETTQFVDAVCDFETLMEVELLDWIEITELDSLELSAS